MEETTGLIKLIMYVAVKETISDGDRDTHIVSRFDIIKFFIKYESYYI